MSNPIVMSINDELLAELESELGQVLRIAEFAGGIDQLSAVGIGSYLRLVTPQKVLSLLASNRALLAHIVELKRDAERLNKLDRIGYAYGFEDMHEGNRWMIDGPFSEIRAAIDAMEATP